ncbi:Transcriptional regulatory protein MoaR1 [bacterium HR07]|uniref:Transcriptional activator domain-containing protein n=1 Tax=Acetithermum autotrophicum TaxID=1446466 RepID=H5SRY4_ACEAU|nr:transcriptional activator domain-containing protein [Candidatus Acetothermum autotrophicum]GBC76044.1 Transcriptional regulatory protein MoaR1 [bacterium HR07]
MACLEIRLLGEIEVRRDGQLLVFPTQKVKELFAYLVIHRDHAHPRTVLANLLWPDADEEHGRANLRKALSFLRKMLASESEETRWLVLSGGAARFNAADCWLDSEEFERLITDGVKHKNTESLERAIALYRGTPLVGIYEDWAIAESERLQSLYLDALEQLAEIYQAQRKFQKAIPGWEKVIQIVPWHERAHRELITLYALGGDRTAALRQYREYCEILQRELHVPPLPETQALYEKILRGALPEPVRAVEFPPEVPFVGRERECDLLRNLWHRACAGEGQAVLIGGEVGVGKTSLVEHFANSVGAACLRGAAYSDAPPYDPILQAARDGLKDISHEMLAELPLPWRSELAQFMPELHERFPDLKPNPPSSQGKARWFAALTGLFELFARECPVILFLDDLHWADGATLEYLSYLIAHLKDQRIFLIGTYRTEETLTDSPLSRWREKLPRDFAHILKLSPLSREETDLLLTQLLPSHEREIGDVFYAKTKGNPLFVRELVRSWMASGTLQRDLHGHWKLTPEEISAAQLPESLRGLMKTSLRRVPRRALCVLNLVAIAGRSCTLALLSAVLHQSEEALLDRLDNLRRLGLIVEHEGHYCFSHELVRQVVYDELSTDYKRLGHKKIAEALEKLYPDRLDEFSRELAEHCERAQLWEKALTYMLQAVRRAQRAYAYGEALTLTERALKLFSKLQAQGAARLRKTKLELLDCYTDLFPTIYDIKPALEKLQAVIAEMISLGQELKETAQLCQAYQKRAYLELSAGQREAAKNTLRQAWELSQTLPDPSVTARVLDSSGDVYGQIGEYSQAVEYFRRAAEIWAAQGDAQRHASALKSIGTIQLLLGEYEQAQQSFKGALAGFAAASDLWGQAAVFNNLGIAMCELRRWAQAQEYYEHAYQLMSAVGDRRGLGVILLNLGTLQNEQGRFDEALNYLDRVVSMLGEAGLKGLEVETLSEKGRAHLGRGDLSVALECSTRAMQVLEAQHGMITQAQRFYFTHYQILQAHGRTAEAKIYLQKAYDEVCRVASQIRDEASRASFLQNVPINRQILQAFAGHAELS